MACPSHYYELGYPLENIPTPGRPITQIDLRDTVWPILEGTRALLCALSAALDTNDVDSQQGSAGLQLLAGHLETAMHILRRFDASAERRRGDTGARRREAPSRETAEGED